MDKWLDSLSEDWVSQPRSPHSQQLRSSSSLPSASSPTSASSQSRIPCYKTGKLPSEAAQTSRKSSLIPKQQSREVALKERSPSKLNSSHNSNSKAAKSGKPTERTRLLGRRHASTGSVPSVAQDTVQHKASRVSPAKENKSGGTPDWKRRVLQGKAGGPGPDLFAPIGLEGIFKPPTVGHKTKLEKNKRGKPVTVEEFPSSPPPFPSELASLERSEGVGRRRSSLLRQMEILEDIDEASFGEPLGEEPQLGKEKATVDLPAQEDNVAEHDGNESLSRIVLPRDKDNVLSHKEKRTDSIPAPGYAQSNSQHGASKDDRQSFQDLGSPAVSVDSKIQMHDWTSHSLPDDLSTGTDMYAANGAFVSVRRGGYSSDSSFQQRPLSPSSLPDFDASELRSPSLSIHKQSLKRREGKCDDGLEEHHCSAPVTPANRKTRQLDTPDGHRSSGSPLKLFDKYDTFTNDRLVRRMSKFEQSVHENEDVERAEAGHISAKATKTTEISKIRSAIQRTANSPTQLAEADEIPEKRRVSNFGDGELDRHQFDTTHPLRSNHHSRQSPNHKTPLGDSHSDANAFRFHSITIEAHRTHQTLREQKITPAASGKRQPHSPAKESKAKRRRTLRISEEMKLDIHQYAEHKIPVDQPLNVAKSQTNANVTPGLTSPSPNHSIAGKKRKDARYDSTSQMADPKVLAMRQILRPRTATPSQKGSHNRRSADEDTLTNLSQKSIDKEHKVETPSMNLDHQTQALAGELATFTLNMAHDMSQGARKASVTTADFFNEAKQIMHLIRNQGRPQSSQEIPEEPEELEEVDSGNLQRVLPEQSTIDELSRPPSREGGSIRRLREPAQVDPRVASHLRKFEDNDDLGLALPSSVKMSSLEPQPEILSAADRQSGKGFENGQTERDPPNVRIFEQAIEDQRDVLCKSELHAPNAMTDFRLQSSGSQSTDGPSTSRSVPTGSSRSSGAKAIIAPQVVSHLLSDTVGGMTFDHTKQVWVKRKSSQDLSGRESHSRSGSEITEDFFQDIPDLSVDEFQEKQRTQRPPSARKISSSISDRISNHDHALSLPPEDKSLRPQTRGSAAASTIDQGSAPSKLFQFASSGPAPETRATSLGVDYHTDKALQPMRQTNEKVSIFEKEEHAEEVEHEISILEGRVSERPQRNGRGERQARVITVAFSSPLVDQIQNLDDGDAVSSTDESDLDLSDSPPQARSQSAPAAKGRTSHRFRKKSVYRSGSRRASIGLSRPMSRVDENEELSFSESFVGGKSISMDLMVTTPLPRSRNSLVPAPLSSAQQSSIGFQLSPLSDFTVHKSDDLVNRDMSHVARRRGLLSMHEVEDKLSLAAQDIVKRLTDIQPYEPHWDFLRQVNFHNRNLITLHMLDEFCSRIENLDVSDNELGQLSGAPSSVRQLKANSNCLTDLTAWGHLQNLQYLDISRNNIRKLEGFQRLVHLRELRANHNEVENLDGILDLDGLIKLSLRENFVKAVNFEAFNL